MKIAVSACLLGENCKYNGSNNHSSAVDDFVLGHEVLPICPELLGGLPVPRNPAEIVNGEVKNQDGTCVDNEFRKGAQIALEMILDQNIELVILQPRSPSCGVTRIYDGSFSGKLIPGEGVFAKLLRENGIKTIDADNLD